MRVDKIMLGPEEEMDFLPIIPLNEGGQDDGQELVIPDTIALLPLRNTVLFPGVVLPITVGRDKSIKDKLIGVVAQRDSSVEDPAVVDLEQIGTVAKIVKLIKMPDGGTTIIIQGKTRFRINAIVEEDPYFKAAIQTIPDEEAPADLDFNAYIANIKELAAQIVQLSPNIPAEAAIILRNIEKPAFLILFV